jgi:hypothetical protein
MQTLDKERKRLASSHLEKLLKDVRQNLSHKQHLLTEWLATDKIPLLETMSATFTQEELANLTLALEPLDVQLLKVQEELTNLNSGTS